MKSLVRSSPTERPDRKNLFWHRNACISVEAFIKNGKLKCIRSSFGPFGAPIYNLSLPKKKTN